MTERHARLKKWNKACPPMAIWNLDWLPHRNKNISGRLGDICISLDNAIVLALTSWFWSSHQLPAAWGRAWFLCRDCSSPSALLCPHHTPGVTALRLPCLLFALNVQLPRIAIFCISQDPFQALTRSIYTNKNASGLSEHSYLTNDLQFTSQTHLNIRASPRKHVSFQLQPLCLSLIG